MYLHGLSQAHLLAEQTPGDVRRLRQAELPGERKVPQWCAAVRPLSAKQNRKKKKKKKKKEKRKRKAVAVA